MASVEELLQEYGVDKQWFTVDIEPVAEDPEKIDWQNSWVGLATYSDGYLTYQTRVFDAHGKATKGVYDSEGDGWRLAIGRYNGDDVVIIEREVWLGGEHSGGLAIIAYCLVPKEYMRWFLIKAVQLIVQAHKT